MDRGARTMEPAAHSDWIVPALLGACIALLGVLLKLYINDRKQIFNEISDLKTSVGHIEGILTGAEHPDQVAVGD